MRFVVFAVATLVIGIASTAIASAVLPTRAALSRRALILIGVAAAAVGFAIALAVSGGLGLITVVVAAFLFVFLYDRFGRR